MTSARTWKETTDLPPASTWLLEASAGTGKTYQIAGVFVRLVAEYGVPVDRILTITFTNAATAELRERVRGRLRDARAALRASKLAKADEVVVHLLRLDRRDEMLARIDEALRAFDLAPISTIHAFAQRMLQELALDSHQDSGLELVENAADLIERIVDDTLASLFASATPDELRVYLRGGMMRKPLVDVASAMSGPTRPRLAPQGTREEYALQAAQWASRTSLLLVRWRSDEGRDALREFESDVAQKRLGLTARWVRGWLDGAERWIADGALPGQEGETWWGKLRAESLAACWDGDTRAMRRRPWWPLLEALEALCSDCEQFWATFAPLAGFACDVRERVEAELVRRRALTFDAILSRLAERVARGGGAASALAAAVRDRYDAVLVDEFQDTDEAQWGVIDPAFRDHKRLLLIGDPKQAIYAFRGADVHVYLRAKRVVADTQRWTMGSNWRSDPSAVQAMNALWRAGSGAFEEADDAIDYIEVGPQRPNRLEPKLSGLEIRWLDARLVRGSAGAPIGRKDEDLVSRLVAREALEWLRGKRARIRADGEAEPATVQPQDLAVLVNTHTEAETVRRALARVKIPAVAQTRESVFDTDAARWLTAWLMAVAGGGRDREARAAVVTPLYGWTADELAWALTIADRGDEARAQAVAANVKERDWNAWTDRVRRMAERWSRHGFARAFDREAVDWLPLVLGAPDGERYATDLRHLFELLHVEERKRRLGPGALAEWLRAQANAKHDAALRRLESDARAVRIETVHVSKGLEYPIVFLPFGWSARAERDSGGPLVVRGAAGQELHVATRGDARDDAFARYRAEQRREGLRKTYVALTRAKHRTVAWYGPIGSEGVRTNATPLGRLLMRDPKARGFDDDAMPVFDEDGGAGWTKAKQRLDALAARSQGAIAWTEEQPSTGAPEPWSSGAAAAFEPRVAAWPQHRESLVGSWQVASFTSLSAGSAAPDRDEKIAREPVPPIDAAGDEPDDEAAIDVGLAKPPPEAFPEMPRLARGWGARYGTWVHSVLEAIDFTRNAPKDGGALEVLLRHEAARAGLSSMREELIAELSASLPRLLRTPLGAAADDPTGLPTGLSLKDIAPVDRIDELVFDLRLGDGADTCVDPQKVYDAVLAAGDSGGIARWLDAMRARMDAGKALIGAIRGILTGSIDLVFRCAARDGRTRYYLADYKTNRIDESKAGNYAAPWLEREMAKAGYPLQSLIYTLALHRYLKLRLRERYDYDAAIGGYVYLFLRGMSGEDTPRDPRTGRCLGVFGERWPKAVILALDDAISPGGAR